MSKALAAIFMSMALASCTTSKFTMHDYAITPTHVAKLFNADNIERTALNAVRLKGPSKMGMRSPRFTELLFSTEIIRYTAGTVVIQVRTTPYDDSLMAQRGIVFRIDGDTTTMINGADTSVHYTPLPTGKPFLVELRNDGSWFDVRIGHTSLGLQRTALPATEWVLIGLPNKGSILVGDPQFNFVY
jgi:hypothetical protein